MHDGIEPEELAERVGLAPEDVEAAYGEIERRRVATAVPARAADRRRRRRLSMCGIAGIVRADAARRSTS